MEKLHICWQQPIPILYLFASREDLADAVKVQGIGRFRDRYLLDQKGLYVVYHWSRQNRIVFDIGKTYSQTFERRLKQHLYKDTYLDVILDSHGSDVVIDTMVKVGILKDKASQRRIADIENLLIYCHPSSFNRQSTKSFQRNKAFKLINSGEFFPPFAPAYDSESILGYSS
jgi:hypothetical protein